MASTAAAVAAGGQYGAVELKRNYQRNWAVALGISTAMHFGVVGSYYLGGLLQAEEPPTVSVRILKYSDLGPPPSIAAANTPPPISVSAPVAKPTVGTPVPVPDAEVTAEVFATQTEMSQQVAPVTEGYGEGEGVEIEQDINIQDDGPPPDFVPVEKEPVVVKKVSASSISSRMRFSSRGAAGVRYWLGRPSICSTLNTV